MLTRSTMSLLQNGYTSNLISTFLCIGIPSEHSYKIQWRTVATAAVTSSNGMTRTKGTSYLFGIKYEDEDDAREKEQTNITFIFYYIITSQYNIPNTIYTLHMYMCVRMCVCAAHTKLSGGGYVLCVHFAFSIHNVLDVNGTILAHIFIIIVHCINTNGRFSSFAILFLALFVYVVLLSVFMTFVSHKSNNLFTYIFKMCKCEYNKNL